MKVFLFLLFLFPILSCNQSRKLPENFDYGKIENSVYRNDYFNLEVPIPDKWVIQSKEEIEKLRKTGQKMIEENNKDLGRQVKASEVTSAILLTVFKNKIDTIIDEFNSSFLVMVENLGEISQIKTGREYLVNVKKLMEKSGMDYQFPSDFSSEKIGNKKFDVLEIKNTNRGVSFRQQYYTAIDKRFALSIILSFGTDRQKDELLDIIKRIKYE